MPTVEMTSHLYRFFPEFRNKSIAVPPGSIAEVIGAIDRLSPGFKDYIMDEHGALRRHVLISVDNTVVVDKRTLSDRVPEQATIYIFQALTGG